MQGAARLALAVVLASAVPAAGEDPSPELRGLEELDGATGRFEIALVRKSIDLGSYREIHVTGVSVGLKKQAGQEAPASTGSLIRKRTAARPLFSRDEVARLTAIVSESFLQALGRSDAFGLVGEPGPDTLTVRARFTDLASRRASASARRAGHGERRLTAGMVLFDLVDSRSGELVARFGEHRKIERPEELAEPSGAGGPWPEVGQWVAQATADLLQELEAARQATAEPGADASS